MVASSLVMYLLLQYIYVPKYNNNSNSIMYNIGM